jgi:DNA-binding response OmpR family regulator
VSKILLVEDDEEVAASVRDWLAFDRHLVEHVSNGKDGLELLKECEFELIILDWQLPDLSGTELLRRFRARGGVTPVLILTGRRSIQDKEEGFESGCDDYLTKPFQGKELSLRVKALLRRPPLANAGLLKHGNIELDPEKFQLRKSGQEIRLLPKEFALLEFLLRNPQKLFSPEELLKRVWSSDTEATSEALTTCIKRLRKKMDRPGESSVIRNVHGVGYGICEPKT